MAAAPFRLSVIIGASTTEATTALHALETQRHRLSGAGGLKGLAAGGAADGLGAVRTGVSALGSALSTVTMAFPALADGKLLSLGHEGDDSPDGKDGPGRAKQRKSGGRAGKRADSGPGRAQASGVPAGRRGSQGGEELVGIHVVQFQPELVLSGRDGRRAAALDEGDNPHNGLAHRAPERIDFIHALVRRGPPHPTPLPVRAVVVPGDGLNAGLGGRGRGLGAPPSRCV